MSDRYKTEEGKLYYVTIAVVGWIDVFTRKEYVFELIKNIRYCQQNKGLEIYAYVIMSNHIHMMAKAKTGRLNILLGHFKSFTSKEFIKQIEQNPQERRKEWLMHMFKFFGRGNSQNEEYQFWQNGNHPIELWNNELVRQKINYLHNNPVMQGIVAKPENYLFSSANEFSEIKVSKL